MKQIFALLLLFSFAACNDSAQKAISNTDNTKSETEDTSKQVTAPAIANPVGFDTTYEISKEHKTFMVTGYFNGDDKLDTAILLKNIATANDALFIVHGGTGKRFLLKNGKDVGTDFDDFNWVHQFEIIKKGTKIWNNVIDGEIVGEDQVPESRKIVLKTDGILVHMDEVSGGGIIYFKDGKYHWVQQD